MENSPVSRDLARSHTVITIPSLAEMDSSFRQHLKTFTSSLLSREHLVAKTINGAPLTGKALYDIFGVSHTATYGDGLQGNLQGKCPENEVS